MASTDIDRSAHENVAGTRNVNIAPIAANGNALLLDDQLVTLEAGLDVTNGFHVFPCHDQVR
ncbi:Uncharacterised protein [Mycobacterium tuberculosis]|nr:Uncharacterised protein [Mycobacterium tuberculosis]